jgi:hypothetical protein
LKSDVCGIIPLTMLSRSSARERAVVALALCVQFLGCSGSRPADNARPIVTPSLVEVPPVVTSGAPLMLTFSFAVTPDAPAFTEDYTVFVHLVDDHDKMIGATEHQPPTPTTAWAPGTKFEYTQSLYAPTTSYVGPATIVVGLYSKATGERVPVGGDLFDSRAVAVGTLDVSEQTDSYRVAFRDGWHEPESPSGSGIEWRWSTKSGTLTFANPKKDVDLVLQLDQPSAVFNFPQHVEIKQGESVIDAFELEPERLELKRIPLTESQLGADNIVELAVVSDKTFVPARFAQLRSRDVRQLGVRVFRAYIEPR